MSSRHNGIVRSIGVVVGVVVLVVTLTWGMTNGLDERLRKMEYGDAVRTESIRSIEKSMGKIEEDVKGIRIKVDALAERRP